MPAPTLCGVQDVVHDATLAVLLAVILDRLRLIPSVTWFEQNVDQASVQASLLTSTTQSWWARMTGYINFHHRVRI